MIAQIFCIIAAASLASASLIPIHYAPQPYKFGYNIKDKHSEQYRQEEGTGGVAVKGSYGFTDLRGIKRQVDYVADKLGFRAVVKTNEPGTANQNPAAVTMISEAPYAGGIAIAPLGLGVLDEDLGLGLGINELGLGVNGLRRGVRGAGIGRGVVNGLGLGINNAGMVNGVGIRGVGLIA